MSEPTWTAMALAATSTEYLQKKGIESARLDAELLLARALNLPSRLELYLQYNNPVSASQLAEYREMIRRRAGREPVAYILGEKEFYSLMFHVNQCVMIPRPETEFLIDETLQFCREKKLIKPRILDIGTGCGAIACAIAAHIHEAKVVATDISDEAISIARENTARLGLSDKIDFVLADGPEPFIGQNHFDLLLSNPPYVDPDQSDILAPEVTLFEPHQAIFGGADGLSLIRRIISSAPAILADQGLLAFEIGLGQKDIVSELISKTDDLQLLRFVSDYSGIPRITLAIKRKY